MLDPALAPIPDTSDFADEICADILADASRTLHKLADRIQPAGAGAPSELLPHAGSARALRVAEAYLSATRSVVQVLGHPIESGGLFDDDDLGLVRPRRGLRLPADPMGQMVAGWGDLANAQRLPALVTAWESARRMEDHELEARLRAEIERFLPPEVGRLGLAANAEEPV